jgi:hypothetical protein
MDHYQSGSENQCGFCLTIVLSCDYISKLNYPTDLCEERVVLDAGNTF